MAAYLNCLHRLAKEGESDWSVFIITIYIIYYCSPKLIIIGNNILDYVQKWNKWNK